MEGEISIVMPADWRMESCEVNWESFFGETRPPNSGFLPGSAGIAADAAGLLDAFGFLRSILAGIWRAAPVSMKFV